jgi:hypothetical protein
MTGGIWLRVGRKVLGALVLDHVSAMLVRLHHVYRSKSRQLRLVMVRATTTIIPVARHSTDIWFDVIAVHAHIVVVRRRRRERRPWNYTRSILSPFLGIVRTTSIDIIRPASVEVVLELLSLIKEKLFVGLGHCRPFATQHLTDLASSHGWLLNGNLGAALFSVE